MQWHKNKVLYTAALLTAAAVVVGACSSSKPAKGAEPAPQNGASLTGAGYTTPTTGTGSKVEGGTVYFAEGPNSAPNYIFPMTSPQTCAAFNVQQFSAMLYRPLYWFGDDYSPSVDLDKSIGQKPAWSNGDKTVTITLNDYKWSDGEQVTSRDVELFVDLYKADPATNYCAYVPGFFPDNVVRMEAPNPQTIVFDLNTAYNPTWFLYNELSQITPLPLAWDRTSLSQPAPTSDSGDLPDSTKSGAESVYKFLDAQSKDVAGWASSPLWSVVDGPFKLRSITTTGEVTLVPNPDWSGSPKPSVAKVVEVPFTQNAALFDQVRSAGPAGLTVAGLPSEDAAEVSKVESEGFTYNRAASYTFNYFVLNFRNPKVGPVFSQTYFRQALQHLVDQQGWIEAFLSNTAVPTYSPVPANPPNPLASVNLSADPFPFSIADASQLLKRNGWKVVRNGKTTCVRPGTGPGECGAGITAGEGISFNLDYESGVPTLASEMGDLAAQAKRVGIHIGLTSHAISAVYGAAASCLGGHSPCNWTAENWGGGWVYQPDFLPTGESLFLKGASANFGDYSNAEADKLIDATIYGSDEQQALTAYAKYMEQQVPVIYEPTSIGSFSAGAGTLVSKKLGGYAANVYGYMDPEDWYFTS